MPLEFWKKIMPCNDKAEAVFNLDKILLFFRGTKLSTQLLFPNINKLETYTEFTEVPKCIQKLVPQ